MHFKGLPKVPSRGLGDDFREIPCWLSRTCEFCCSSWFDWCLTASHLLTADTVLFCIVPCSYVVLFPTRSLIWKCHLIFVLNLGVQSHNSGGSIRPAAVYVYQPASCELRLWLVRLDWYSLSTRCHLLPKRSGLDSACRHRKFPIFWSPKNWSQLFWVPIRFPIGFLIFGLSIYASRKVLRKHPEYSNMNILFPLFKLSL